VTDGLIIFLSILIVTAPSDMSTDATCKVNGTPYSLKIEGHRTNSDVSCIGLGPRIDLRDPAGRTGPVRETHWLRDFSTLELFCSSEFTATFRGQSELTVCISDRTLFESLVSNVMAQVYLRRSDCNTNLFFIEPLPDGVKLHPASVLSRNFPQPQHKDVCPIIPASTRELRHLTKDSLARFMAESEFTGKYAPAKLQWSMSSIEQWRNNPLLRAEVKELENLLDIDAPLFAHFAPNELAAKKCALNVMLTYAIIGGYESFKNVKIKSLIPFLTVYETTAEEEIFSMYALIRSRFWSGLLDPSMLEKRLKTAGVILSIKRSAVLEFYARWHVDNIDFLINECSSMFMGCLDSFEDLWIGVLETKVNDLPKFFDFFLAAYLVILWNEMHTQYIVNYGDFCHQFQSFKQKIPLTAVLDQRKKLTEELPEIPVEAR
jgi:hypothetical protein